MNAYVRRKQWEAEQTAMAVWNLLGKAMGKRAGEQVAPGDFLRMTGQKL